MKQYLSALPTYIANISIRTKILLGLAIVLAGGAILTLSLNGGHSTAAKTADMTVAQVKGARSDAPAAAQPSVPSTETGSTTSQPSGANGSVGNTAATASTAKPSSAKPTTNTTVTPTTGTPVVKPTNPSPTPTTPSPVSTPTPVGNPNASFSISLNQGAGYKNKATNTLVSPYIVTREPGHTAALAASTTPYGAGISCHADSGTVSMAFEPIMPANFYGCILHVTDGITTRTTEFIIHHSGGPTN